MLKVVLLCVFIGGSGVGYVWQKNQIHQLGEQITRSEKRLQELVQQNKLRAISAMAGTAAKAGK